MYMCVYTYTCVYMCVYICIYRHFSIYNTYTNVSIYWYTH